MSVIDAVNDGDVSISAIETMNLSALATWASIAPAAVTADRRLGCACDRRHPHGGKHNVKFRCTHRFDRVVHRIDGTLRRCPVSGGRRRRRWHDQGQDRLQGHGAHEDGAAHQGPRDLRRPAQGSAGHRGRQRRGEGCRRQPEGSEVRQGLAGGQAGGTRPEGLHLQSARASDAARQHRRHQFRPGAAQHPRLLRQEHGVQLGAAAAGRQGDAPAAPAGRGARRLRRPRLDGGMGGRGRQPVLRADRRRRQLQHRRAFRPATTPSWCGRRTPAPSKCRSRSRRKRPPTWRPSN